MKRLDVSRRGLLMGLGASTLLADRRAIAATEPADSTYHTATELLQALATRQVSARELLNAAIARIEALDTKVNAVVVRDFDRARAAADTADTALARGEGERRPLLGLPMTVKEQFNVAGLPTSWGIPRFRGWRPDEDAVAVRRLKAAGAVIIGKTNVPQGLADWQSYNSVYGTTNNPWDLGRTPGGSSGGSAAALAAGFVPLELGSDIGGSLRAPAHYCGVYAHKSSLDLIPQRGGGFPGSPAVPVRGDMSVAGPMARSAADLALELDVLAGPDELWDGIGYKLALPPPRHDSVAEFRALVVDRHPLCPTAATVSAALDALSERLAKLGCRVTRTNPEMPNLARTTRAYDELLMAFFGAELPPDERVRLEAAASALAPEDESLAAAELRGFTMSHPAWVRTSRIRDGLRARWQALFKEVDVILCPPMPTPAFPHDHSPMAKRQIDIDGKKGNYDDQIAWCAIATLTGLPATVAPIGQSEDGLPVGVQIIGGYLEDRTTIKFADLIEHQLGGFRPPPKL
ncbi:MAG: amidase [Acetobacteraceae bacterium]|nr:amidase [Acetobacteraceae bacterium]